MFRAALLAALLLSACAVPQSGTPAPDDGPMVTIFVDNQGWNEVRVELHARHTTPKRLGSVPGLGSACFRIPQQNLTVQLLAQTVLGGRRYIASPPFAIQQRPGWIWRISDGASQGMSINHAEPCRGRR